MDTEEYISFFADHVGEIVLLANKSSINYDTAIKSITLYPLVVNELEGIEFLEDETRDVVVSLLSIVEEYYYNTFNDQPRGENEYSLMLKALFKHTFYYFWLPSTEGDTPTSTDCHKEHNYQSSETTIIYEDHHKHDKQTILCPFCIIDRYGLDSIEDFVTRDDNVYNVLSQLCEQFIQEYEKGDEHVSHALKVFTKSYCDEQFERCQGDNCQFNQLIDKFQQEAVSLVQETNNIIISVVVNDDCAINTLKNTHNETLLQVTDTNDNNITLLSHIQNNNNNNNNISEVVDVTNKETVHVQQTITDIIIMDVSGMCTANNSIVFSSEKNNSNLLTCTRENFFDANITKPRLLKQIQHDDYPLIHVKFGEFNSRSDGVPVIHNYRMTHIFWYRSLSSFNDNIQRNFYIINVTTLLLDDINIINKKLCTLLLNYHALVRLSTLFLAINVSPLLNIILYKQNTRDMILNLWNSELYTKVNEDHICDGIVTLDHAIT